MNLPDYDHFVRIYGARANNLKNISLNIPRNKLTVITGLSGSGKSSLAFDTLYAEGQRRYIETFSSYARQFLGNMERPDVDKITGLSPVISIEQKTASKNPRSTVGTITEIYDFLRLLYAKISDAYSFETGEKMVKYTEQEIIQLIYTKFFNRKILVLAPVVKGRKGHYKELFDHIRNKGFLHIRIDGSVRETEFGLKLDRYKAHYIEIVIDKLHLNENQQKRLKDSIQTALIQGKGGLMIMDVEEDKVFHFSRQLMCPTTGISYNEPAPHTFSFNSPQGACPKCNGLGTIQEIEIHKIIPDPKLSIAKGGIMPLGPYKSSLIFWQLEAIAKKFNFSLHTPIGEIPEHTLNIILFGSEEVFSLKNTPMENTNPYLLNFEGIIHYLSSKHNDLTEKNNKENQHDLLVGNLIPCSECKGSRLKKESLYFKIDGKNIAELSEMNLSDLTQWFESITGRLTKKQTIIAKEIIKEIQSRLCFLTEVGLEYLSINRSAKSLSGGESQRIRLATQIGSQLVNILYIIDEPSIGLHQRDNERLIQSLRKLRDIGNSVIVVEHDKQMILSADHVIDIGPFAGKQGGSIVAQGSPEEIMQTDTLTAQYLTNKQQIQIPAFRRKGNGQFLVLKDACGNNLKNITVKFPLGMLICVTGVSGSGKSSLINETLYPILRRYFYHSFQKPLGYGLFEGIEYIDKVIEVDQSPLGKTPRSNPATYSGIFTDIRKFFEQLPESKIRGYKASRFSFNVKGGRCEECKGSGVKTIEMNFLPDVYVHCKECNGKRYNRETLDVRYKGKSISDILNMTIEQGVDFFSSIPSILIKLNMMKEIGLGYITMGQASTTLSGGESQRIKLATELSKRDTGKTIYILDEPTTGLHFEDIKVLLDVLNRLVNKGNTVIVIEHNMDVIKTADYIIDLGKEGGMNGGNMICCGKPEEIIFNKESYTAPFLEKELTAVKIV